MIGLITFIGGVFGVLGAIMAGLITYEEYTHHYPDRAPAIRAGIGTGVTTLLFFIVIFAVIGAVLDRVIGGQ
jgi:uncharacterized membrane protein